MSEYITLLDVDGSCAKFNEDIMQAVAPHRTEQDLIDLNDWDVFKLFNKEELDYCHEVLKEDSFWRNLTVHEDAIIEVEKMRKNGERVIFLTSPWDGCNSWCGARKAWLKKYFKAEREDLFIGTSKDLVFGHRLIDDRLSNIVAWQKRWKTSEGLLFEIANNKKCDYYPRMIRTPDGWKKEILWNRDR